MKKFSMDDVIEVLFTSAILIALFSALYVTRTHAMSRPQSKKVSSAVVTTAAATPIAQPLAWGHPEWDKRLRALVGGNLERFETAKDLKVYCPKWGSLTTERKVDALSKMIVRIAFHESAYGPTMHYGEPPPLGYDSIGLFQLSYEDKWMTWCRMDRKSKSLEDPLNNIDCAVPYMAKLVARDGQLWGGWTGSNAKGMSRYWSVTRSMIFSKKRKTWIERESHASIISALRNACAV